MKKRLLLTLALTTGLAVGIAPLALQPSAEAAKPRCTIVGTNRADVLKGTPGRDVICGRGGADRILGKGGRDVIRAGRGADTVIDGKGVDRVFGGPGADRLISGAVDKLGSPNGPADVLRGGSGEDRLQGSYTDKVSGGPGDDDLFGYVLKGGAGNDYCVHWDDDIALCENDSEPPAFGSVALTPGSLDLAAGAATLMVRARLIDDLGAVSLTPSLMIADPDGGPDLLFGGPDTTSKLISGKVRNGVWRAKVVVPAGSPSGEYTLELLSVGRGLSDKAGLWSGTIDVTNGG